MKTIIKIKNFKQLEDITLEIKPLTLLFGPNGSGKSSFLKAIEFLSNNISKIDEKKENGLLYDFNDVNLNTFSDIVTNNDTKRIIQFKISFELTNDECWNKVASNESFIPEFNSFPEYLKDNDLEKKQNNKYKDDNLINSQLFNIFSGNNNESFNKLFKENEIIKFDITFSINVDGKLKLELHDFNSNTNCIFSNYEKPKIDVGNEIFKIITEREYSKVFEKRTNENFWLKYPRLVYNIFLSESILGKAPSKKDFFLTLSLLYKYYIIFPKVIKGFLAIGHINAVREIPKDKYLLKNNKFPRVQHYFFDEYLTEEEYKGFDKYMLNVSNQRESYDYNIKYEYWSRVFYYLKQLGLAKGIYTKKINGIGYVIVENLNNSRVGLNQASSGLLQVLPILILFGDIGWIYDEIIPNTLLIEQPELHLHPKIQSKLADIFYEVANYKDRNFYYIVETHSEHIIRKLQVLVAQNKVKTEFLGIYYFSKKKGKTKVTLIEFEPNGFFKNSWPDGFFDDSSDLVWKLLQAQVGRKN